MKNWSLPRLALLLWFAFYALFALVGLVTPDRPTIFGQVVLATCAMFIGLLFVGLTQES
jgi:hypothetical protein